MKMLQLYVSIETILEGKQWGSGEVSNLHPYVPFWREWILYFTHITDQNFGLSLRETVSFQSTLSSAQHKNETKTLDQDYSKRPHWPFKAEISQSSKRDHKCISFQGL